MSDLKLRIFELPPIGTNAYLLTNELTGEAALFDAPFGAMQEVDRILEKTGSSLVGVWLTHGHWDHMLDAHRFNESGVPVYAHKDDEYLIRNPDVMASFSIPGISFKAAHINSFLLAGQNVEILGEPVEILHVPGHSAGSVAFLFRRLGWLISGDVVFSGSVGRTDFPGCSHEQLMSSIKTQILPLADETVIYPGHGPKTTLGKERHLNPFLRELV
jgi:hydroxyacylglutathione hydrolase